MKNKLLVICLALISYQASSQKKLDMTAQQIPSVLLKGVNKVTVSRQEINEILSQTTLKQQFSEINFIENKQGLDDLDISLVYDKLSKLQNIEFKIYNGQGEIIKTYKKQDFADTSLADGFSILTDDRLKHLTPTHFTFPIFTKFDYEIEYENTISIPSFFPLSSSYDRIMNASYELRYPENFSIKKTEQNITEYNIQSQVTKNSISYKVANLIAPEYEEMNYNYQKMLPITRFSNNTFGLGNVKGTANSWNEFGVWYYTHFLKGLNELPETTVLKMKELTKNATNDIDKAKIVFDYVQSNTRYISIQLGLGGWRPFPAKEVDKLGYGDCKALTNYTKSLLDAVGVTSYYTIIHASNRIVDIDERSIGLQGNHVILTLPTAQGNVFLECTSQKIPFGYLGTSTINRKALLIKPNDAEFVTTYAYNEKQNILKGHFVIDLKNLQKVKSTIAFENKGVFYYNLFSLNTNDKKEIDLYVKNTFSKLNGLNVVDYKSTNDKESYTIKENIVVESAFIGSKMGNDYMISVNSLLPLSSSLKKYKNRKTDFNITVGKTYALTTEYILPGDLDFNFIPESNSIRSEFGNYNISFQKTEGKLIVTEDFVIKSGNYTKEKYSDYEKFIQEVNQNSNSKIILSKK